MAWLRGCSRPLVFLVCVALAASVMRGQVLTDPPALAEAPPAAAAEGPKGPPRAVMASLFAGFIATQALDVHSTLTALDRGAREANGTVRWATSSPAAFIGVKAATTTATCLVIDRIRRRHPKRAMFLLAGIDAAFAAIVGHNYMNAQHR